MAPIGLRKKKLYTSELKALHRYRPSLLKLPERVYVDDVLGPLAPILTQDDIDEILLKNNDLDQMLELVQRVELYKTGFKQVITALQDPGVEQLTLAERIIAMEKLEHSREERKVLVDLYAATNGPSWARNDNWCSDCDLNQWEGVEVNEAGCVSALKLGDNNLVGELPHSLATLRRLEKLFFAFEYN